MGVYGNHAKVSKIAVKCARLLNPNLHSHNTLFWLKRWLKKGIVGVRV